MSTICDTSGEVGLLACVHIVWSASDGLFTSVLVGVCCAWSFVVSLLHLSHSIFKGTESRGLRANGIRDCASVSFAQHAYHCATLPDPPLPCSALTRLFAKQPADSPQHAVLLRVVGVVFARDFEDGRECLGVGIDPVPYLVGDLERDS